MTALDESAVNPGDPATAWHAEHVLGEVRDLRARIVAAQAKRDRAVQRATERADQWLASETGRDADTLALREAWLREWIAGWRELTGEASYSCPEGKVSTRLDAEVWDWGDDKALLAELQAIAEDRFVRTRTSTTTAPDKTAVKKAAVVKDGAVYLDGELLAGVTVAPRLTIDIETADDNDEETGP